MLHEESSQSVRAEAPQRGESAMTLAPAELAEFLTKNQLLSHTQLEAVAREADHFVSAAQMSDELVARGWLTKFQQSHLLSGQGDKLILGPYRLVDSLG